MVRVWDSEKKKEGKRWRESYKKMVRGRRVVREGRQVGRRESGNSGDIREGRQVGRRESGKSGDIREG